MESFYDRLKKTCADKGISVFKMLCECEISEGAPARWRQNHLPSATTLIKISEYLDVSTDYLLMGKPGPDLLTSEHCLLKLYRQLSITAKAYIFSTIKDILRTGVMKDADD